MKRKISHCVRNDKEEQTTSIDRFFPSYFYDYLFSRMNHNYFVYIVTNPGKTVLYIGVTNDLSRRIQEHYENRGKSKSFAGKYFCYNLIYWERFSFIDHAIDREKEIKGWNRKKKENLISSLNPQWEFLNYSDLS